MGTLEVWIGRQCSVIWPKFIHASDSVSKYCVETYIITHRYDISFYPNYNENVDVDFL